MIVSIGEILADIIFYDNGKLDCNVGGAPFNVAVNCAANGGDVAFAGRVGNDVIGRYLIDMALQTGLKFADIQKDDARNTTLAFVSLDNGERSFSFFRRDTADYNVDFDEVDFKKYGKPDILHLGSLMLSEKTGRRFADRIIEKVDAENIVLSFDVNLRPDLFPDMAKAREYYAPVLRRADILKFSEEEIYAFSGKNNLSDAAQTFFRQDRLLLVTMGSRGSAYFFNGKSGVVPTRKVVPVDTTGAGDAFFGAVLAYIAGKKPGDLCERDILVALEKGNECGAKTTLFKGALKI